MALILALVKVNGDLCDNEAKLKAALAKIEIDAPNGKIKLDDNRQAIGTNFVTEVVDDGKGALVSKVVKVIPTSTRRWARSGGVRQDRSAEPDRSGM